MRGSIERRGKSSWRITVDMEPDVSGERRRVRETVRGLKRDAEARLAQILADLANGGFAEPTTLTVKDYLARWIEHVESKVSRKTHHRYSEIVDRHLVPALGSQRLQKLRPLHIQGMYAAALKNGRLDGKGGLAPRTVLHHHRVLHEALRQAVRWQLLSANPCDAVEAPTPERREMASADADETARLLSAAEGTTLYVPIMVAVTTGLRRGELLALRWRDVDLEGGRLFVTRTVEEVKGELRFKEPKTEKSRRQIRLSPITVDALRLQRKQQAERRLLFGPDYQDNDLVFDAPAGEPWPPMRFSGVYRGLVKRAGLRLRFHDLRHSHATQLLAQGIHPKIVSERLGHSTIALTLDTYSHVLPTMQDEAAEKIDESLRAAMGRNSRPQSVPK